MTGQANVDKPNKAMIGDCDKYGHAHSAAGEIKTFSLLEALRPRSVSLINIHSPFL
jgi:hypothetical protein